MTADCSTRTSSTVKPGPARHLPRHRSTPGLTGLLALLPALASAAPGQPVAYVSRNGMNVAYCGVSGSGLLAQHDFALPAPTDDSISLSDPGGPSHPESAATSHMTAMPGQFGLSLAISGSATRGALPPGFFGVYAVADARDQWIFTIAKPMRFTLSVTLTATSSEATTPVHTFYFLPWGGGAQIIADPGTPPGPYSAALTTPGTLTQQGIGTLLPGSYLVSLNGRAEGSSYPYSGSFAGSLAVGLGPFDPTLPAPTPPVLIKRFAALDEPRESIRGPGAAWRICARSPSMILAMRQRGPRGPKPLDPWSGGPPVTASRNPEAAWIDALQPTAPRAGCEPARLA